MLPATILKPSTVSVDFNFPVFTSLAFRTSFVPLTVESVFDSVALVASVVFSVAFVASVVFSVAFVVSVVFSVAFVASVVFSVAFVVFSVGFTSPDVLPVTLIT